MEQRDDTTARQLLADPPAQLSAPKRKKMATMIKAAALKELMASGAANLRLFDCSSIFMLGEDGKFLCKSGRPIYDEGHITGAGFFDVVDDFADPSGQFFYTLLSVEAFAKAATAAGIDDNKELILYSNGELFWATRAWWLLMYYGFPEEKIRILDGGLAAWKEAGFDVSTDFLSYPPSTSSPFTQRPVKSELFADKENVMEVVKANGEHETILVNSLTRPFFTGEAPVNFGRPGRIPTSRNVSYADVVDEKGIVKPAEQLKDLFTAAGIDSNTKTISYCGGGVGATVVLLAHRLAGFATPMRVYDGSLSEWSGIEELPLVVD